MHEQLLSRQHEIKAVISSLNSFNSRADAVSVKLTAFKENVHKHATKPLSTDVNAIKADLQLIKVSCFCHVTDVCCQTSKIFGAILHLV